MRFLFLVAVVVSTSAVVIPRGNDALLKGVLCRPCVDIITNGENRGETAFNTWFDAETTKYCGDLGFLKNECIQYFKQYENEFDHFISTKAEPTASCKTIDFC